MVKRLPTMRETWVQSLSWEDPLEKEMAIHSRTIAWKIPRTEEPGRLQSMGSQRVGHDWATSLFFFTVLLPFYIFIFSIWKENPLSFRNWQMSNVLRVLHLRSLEVKWSEVKLLNHVRLFATPWTIAYQAPPSMGFSRQEYWSGLPFPSPGDLPDPGIEPRSPTL